MLLCAFNQSGAAYGGNVTTGRTDPGRADAKHFQIREGVSISP